MGPPASLWPSTNGLVVARLRAPARAHWASGCRHHRRSWGGPPPATMVGLRSAQRYTDGLPVCGGTPVGPSFYSPRSRPLCRRCRPWGPVRRGVGSETVLMSDPAVICGNRIKLQLAQKPNGMNVPVVQMNATLPGHNVKPSSLSPLWALAGEEEFRRRTHTGSNTRLRRSSRRPLLSEGHYAPPPQA